jgi:hypothetical protein
MSYALISEAWKIDNKAANENEFKQRPEIKTNLEPFDNVSNKISTNIEENPLAYQYYQDFEPEYDENYDSDDEMDCMSVLEHVKKCKICQSKIIEERGKSENLFSLSDNFLDILLYTISGIFILFLLDTVLRIGKSLR